MGLAPIILLTIWFDGNRTVVLKHELLHVLKHRGHFQEERDFELQRGHATGKMGFPAPLDLRCANREAKPIPEKKILTTNACSILTSEQDSQRRGIPNFTSVIIFLLGVLIETRINPISIPCFIIIKSKLGLAIFLHLLSLLT